MLDWIAPSSIAGVALILIGWTVKKMVTEKIATRIGGFPRAAFWLALRFIPKNHRADRADEWSGDLEHLIADTEGKPLTRIVSSTRFCGRLVLSARKIRRELTPRVKREKIDIPNKTHMRWAIQMPIAVAALTLSTLEFLPSQVSLLLTGGALMILIDMMWVFWELDREQRKHQQQQDDAE